RIHIYFYGIFQKLVDEKSVFRMGFEHALGIEFELILFDGNTHALAAQHVAGTDKHRVADAIGNLDSAFHIFGRAVRGEGDIQFFEEFGKRTSIFGKIDHLKGSTKNMDTFFHKTLAQLQRCLSAYLQDNALGLLMLVDVQHAFPEDGFEVKLISNIEIGGDRFGITVHHDGLVAHILHGFDGVHAGVVKFDTLADAVGTAAEDHHLLF